MHRLLITGSSGYLGRRLVAHFQAQGKTICGIDLHPPPSESPPGSFIQADICDANLLEAIREFSPDTVVHAAFVFQPMRDLQRMAEINIGGTENVLRIVREVSPARYMLLSSATAFGAWPDNPVPMPEDWPMRSRGEYPYAAHKTAIEAQMVEFAEQQSETAVSWIRPAIIGGPSMENYLSRFIFGMPFLAKLDGFDCPLQFVHEDDVVAAMEAILLADGRGPFNVGPPNWTCTTEIAKETKRRAISLPFWLAWGSAWLAWNTRLWLHESPAGFLYFARYPWVVAPHRLLNELRFQFRYSSTETVRDIVKNL